MNILPFIAFQTSCPKCSDTLLVSRRTGFICDHCSYNLYDNIEIEKLYDFYANELIESTEKLKNNKEIVEKLFNVKLNSSIRIE